MSYIKPAIEIGILFFMFYMVLLSMRGTRGAGMLKGLFFIFMITFLVAVTVSKIFELEVVLYILQNWLPTIAIFTLIVIFHPELRNALLKLGQTKLFYSFFKHKSMVLEEVIDAAIKLSRSKTGMLVAIERDIGLKNYIEGGVKIDSEVTSELLQTIFFPKTALHDGAVIIKEERIAAAGCLFPLTDNMELSKTVGTRHRAGIGITEESDAIVVIVSEETGTISVALNGKLTSDLDKDSLRKLLESLYLKPAQAQIQAKPTEIKEATKTEGTK
ncbi:MAG: TIGR00159 family protein [Planctomycetes bacterium]|nr:TIGR00159 family protein [Planctomycetota bacterium]